MTRLHADLLDHKHISGRVLQRTQPLRIYIQRDHVLSKLKERLGHGQSEAAYTHDSIDIIIPSFPAHYPITTFPSIYDARRRLDENMAMRVSIPTLPKYIRSIMMIFPATESCGVMPIVRPTVANADTSS